MVSSCWTLGRPHCLEGNGTLLRGPRSEAIGWGHFWGLQVPSPVCSTVGPCALEYTKMKTADHFWTDPSADELVQRHRIHSSHLRQDSPTKRPALCVRWVGSVRVSGQAGNRAGVLTVTHCSLSLSLLCADTRSRRGIPAAAWTTGHPSLPGTM